MFVDDLMADLLKLFLDLTVIVVLFYARGYIAERVSMAKGEFYVLVLLATLGMMVMISANHLLTLYLGLEMMSLSVYAMVALNRDSTQATEAAMKYFVLGALASGLLLYGISMVYGATGTLEITQVAQALAQGAVNKPSWSSAWCSWWPASPSSWAWFPSTCGFRTSITALPPR